MPPRRRAKPRSPDHAALGEAVRRLRKEAGLSQEQLADRAEIDFTQVGGVERGQRNPGYETLLCLAAALGTSVSGLLALADEIKE
jgi:transcriptional regulator with XRE-family HTH domain